MTSKGFLAALVTLYWLTDDLISALVTLYTGLGDLIPALVTQVLVLMILYWHWWPYRPILVLVPLVGTPCTGLCTTWISLGVVIPPSYTGLSTPILAFISKTQNMESTSYRYNSVIWNYSYLSQKTHKLFDWNQVKFGTVCTGLGAN